MLTKKTPSDYAEIVIAPKPVEVRTETTELSGLWLPVAIIAFVILMEIRNFFTKPETSRP